MRVRLYKKTKDNRYYFQFLSDDGQAVLSSQGYTDQEARDLGLRSVIANAADPARYERLFSATGTPFFTIKAGNGQEIARSVDFETAAAMEVGIAGCMAKIPALAHRGGGKTATEPGLHPGNNAALDDYLPCERYNGGAEFHRFFNGEDESWYFGYNDVDGEPLLRSEGYKSEKARENGIESVLKNAPLEERWATGHDDAGFYYALRAGNHQEIARSCYFGEESAMLAKFAAAKTAFQPKAATRIVDDYLPCEAYAGEAGYYRFEKDGEYYFGYNDSNGHTILRSEGYKTESARENGIESVKKNAPIEERWVKATNEAGHYYFSLRAGNHQEIARTCYHETEAALLGVLRTAVGPLYVPPPPVLEVPATRIVDDYLPCEAYAGGAGYYRFEKDGEYYFGYNDVDGETLLRSEGYKSEKARENGIESVLKNAPLEERWATGHDDAGFYYALRAGNHQEIARSCYFGEESAMLAKFAAAKTAFQPKAATRIVDDYLPCEAYAGGAGYYRFEKDGEYYFGYNDSNGHTILRSEGYKTESARENGIESVKKNAPIEERWVKATNEAGHYYFSLRAGNHQEIARTCYHETEAALLGVLRTAVGPLYVPPPPVLEAAAPVLVDDYLPCEAYAGGAGYYRFEKDGEYYFGYNDSNGHTILRSEGYKTESARENGIESVKKNAPIEERWVKATNEAGHYYFSLRAGNHQEIARTCYHETEAALLGVLRTAVGPLYVPPPPVLEAAAPVLVDDYLPCEAYAGEAKDGFRRFKHEGNWYFAYNDKNGKPILRSEAYKSEKARENGIESVKRNRKIKEHWIKNKTDDGRYYYSLIAGNRQEIARSCYFEDEAGLLAAWGALPVFAALAAAAIPAAAAAAVPPPPAADKPVAAPVAAVPPKAAVPPPPVAASTGSGGFRWWWLLPLLLLLPLLFFLMRGCDGCKTTPPPPPPAETTVVPTPVPADTAKEETPAAPATPVETACACKGSENPILNIPEGAAPKLLRRLGTNPEFGNSHGLDGKAFFEKLTSQYSKSTRDKRFLDDLFKAMGYPNGFKDATASLFTEVTVPVGTVGNMGYSVEHKTLYAQVPDTERDRLAFHIKSANGCDMHFMKTCGNHFFFCPN